MTWRVIHADCLDAMAELEEASVDAVVTDPPYGLEFMGKEWDRLQTVAADPSTVGGFQDGNGGNSYSRARGAGMQEWHAAWAAEALRVLKPGGHLLAFGGTRTYHRLACALEDAGFEIRDCLAWLYGSGFPKSLDVSKAIDKAAGAAREVVGTKLGQPGYSLAEGHSSTVDFGPQTGDPEREAEITAPATPDAERWQGWGTALKPAFEPIVLARKPLSGTVAQNVLEYGVGALNVDGTRIESDRQDTRHGGGVRGNGSSYELEPDAKGYDLPSGRWPANVVLDESAAEMLDEQSGERPAGVAVRHRSGGNTFGGDTAKPPMEDMTYADAGGASRFFYTAKTSRAEREVGQQYGADRNNHPTVKPVDLMQWLCRLITPPKGLILDPFLGSGSTGIAALREGFEFIGIEREADYVEIARARIIGDAPLLNVGTEVES